MIGFVRFAGILNAAIWFGATAFYTFGAVPALASREMETMLSPKNLPYFSVAIAQVVAARLFVLQSVCLGVAVLHLVVEWLYLGKVPRKFWGALLAGVIATNLCGGLLVEPALKKSHQAAYTSSAGLEARKVAYRRFRAWQSVSDVVNLLLVGGLGVYLWRVANPADPTRFLSTTKFRS